MNETDWMEAWACTHLWNRSDAGDGLAQDEIATAAFDFMVDTGENIALCDQCRKKPQGIPITLRHIRSGYSDDGMAALIAESRPGRLRNPCHTVLSHSIKSSGERDTTPTDAR